MTGTGTIGSAAIAAIAARPLAIGEIFDRAVTLLARRWRAALLVGAAVSLLPTLAQGLIVADRASPFALWLLRIVGAAGYLYGFAALVAILAGGSPRELVAAPAARLLRAGLVAGFVFSLAWIVANAVSGLAWREMASGAIAIAPAGAVLLGAAFAILYPLMLVSQVAVATAVLEGTGGTRSFVVAATRALVPGQRLRTALLAYAVSLAYSVLNGLPDLALGAEARSTDHWWLTAAAVPLATIGSFAFLAAVVTVAANDYRVRREGADLEAALDARPAL